MAWRIDQSVIRGEIDNRTRGRVTGRIWLLGREAPVELELKGDAWRDLAGHSLRFSNPAPRQENLQELDTAQRGVVGDITAARKVKVPDCSMEEFKERSKTGTPFTWHWANALYLEWFSETNGRVVIESTSYELALAGEAAWSMTEEEEVKQREENQRALSRFMERLLGYPPGELVAGADPAEFEDEPPQSAAEAEADAEAARMDLLLDRIQARIESEGGAEADFERIMEEERERLRRERGEPEPRPLTQEEEEERSAWIEEMNAAAEEGLANGEEWKDQDDGHPLVDRCTHLAIRLRNEVEEAGWLRETDLMEHPLREVVDGVMIAGPKMAGAFATSMRDEWPPDPMFAGHVLVRLKKARRYLRDAIAGLDAADREGLASAEWRNSTRREVTAILDEVHQHIAEVRAVLEESD